MQLAIEIMQLGVCTVQCTVYSSSYEFLEFPPPQSIRFKTSFKFSSAYEDLLYKSSSLKTGTITTLVFSF